ncbi:MAG: NAD(P)/FAD-dependent oxidoreductase [Thermonemataceae bacterium]
MKTDKYDVIIIGGSYSGLAAAMTLGRAIRKTLVIDSGKPCNKQTPYAHNFITQDGVAPHKIAQEAKKQVLAYPTVSFIEDMATDVTGTDGDFTVTTQANQRYEAKKIIFATGVRDIMPEIPGFAESWGITAIHCPYCHGYEERSKNTGILVNDESALDFAKLILNWTDKLTIYTNGAAQFNVAPVNKVGVEVIEKEIQMIANEKGKITHLQFKDNSVAELEALYHRAKYEQHCKIPEKIGCQLTESGYIEVNDFQQTNVMGVYAIGDATTAFRAVSVASASGTKAAAILNHELIAASWTE